MKFFSSEAALYLYKSTICPCMEYCCHVWASGPSCYLDLLDKLQNKYTGLLVLHLLLLLNPLAHHRDVASLSLFYRYYFGRCSSELTQLVPLPFSCLKSTHNSDRLHDFSVTIPRCYKDVYVNRHLLNSSFFVKRFPWCFNFFVLIFLVTPCLVVAV